MQTKLHFATTKPLYITLAGSRLYGTARNTSDYDYRGVVYDPVAALLGLGDHFDTYHNAAYGGEDIEVYGLRKFIKLALANNPNILDILFASPEYWETANPDWLSLYNTRHLFLATRVRQTFSGYAYGQYSKLKLQADDDTYDYKDAAHLYRLLVKGIAILKWAEYDPVLSANDSMVVRRILDGKMPYWELLELADDMFAELKTVHTDLPEHPAYATIEALIIEINGRWIAKGGQCSENMICS